jgi:hypothetical protein
MSDEKDTAEDLGIDLKELPVAKPPRAKQLLRDLIASAEESIGDMRLVAEIDLAVGDKESLKQRKELIAKIVKRRDEAQRRLDAMK